ELIWNLESLSLDQNSFLWGHPKEQFNLENESEDEDNESSLSSSENLPFESNWDRLRREYDSKGFSVDSHPLSILRSYLKTKNAQLIANRFIPYFVSENLPKMKNKTKVRVAGLVSVTQRPPTAKGMCFITLEDEFGFMNIVIPPDIYQKDRQAIYGHSLLEIQGHIEKAGNILNIKATRVLPLQ
ncbi:MAG: OB-fold nucleic acid binding domain-containing protein, partial [Bdellovibrio sp.]